MLEEKKEQKFSLITEPWIRVLMLDGTEAKLSLRDAFRDAPKIRTLAGETPLQDTAMLRLLTAISITILYRYDENGGEKDLKNTLEADKRFKAVWMAGCYPEKACSDYMEKWKDRFWLFGGERPFFQVPACRRRVGPYKGDKIFGGYAYYVEPYAEMVDRMCWFSTAKLNGLIQESKAGVSYFCDRAGIYKDRLDPDEAARWLVHYMSYADCSSKISHAWNAKQTYASSGMLIHPAGENLFQTLMLCSDLDSNNGNLYHSEKQREGVLPAWEDDSYVKINGQPYGDGIPGNLPELYTQQSRKIVLHEGEDGLVDGFFLAAGACYGGGNPEVPPLDPMLIRHHVCNLQFTTDGLWKKFSYIFVDSSQKDEQKKNPCRWICRFGWLFPDGIVPFQATDVEYDSNKSVLLRMLSAGITVDQVFFKDADKAMEAENEIVNIINKISDSVHALAWNLELAAGSNVEKKKSAAGQRARDRYETLAGHQFCRYLTGKLSLDGLHMAEFRLAYDTADWIFREAGAPSLRGHGDHSAGKAESSFRAGIAEIRENAGLPDDAAYAGAWQP